MPRYKNLSGNSSVVSYNLEDEGISVVFHNGATYRWSYDIAGEGMVEEMKALAVAGQGLNSFIQTVARDWYD